MAYSVHIQPTALHELDRIVEYLLSFGPHTASNFLNEWQRSLSELREGQEEHRLSRFEPLARLGYHTLIIKNYIVLYLKEDGYIIIAHIFHQSQDYARIVLSE